MIAVGRRVFVNCPASRSGSVALVDETGKIFSSVSLADGVEVEVVAWRPRVAGDAHYRVRASLSGADGWLPAVNLRKVLVPIPPPESPVARATPVADNGGTRFGQRPHANRPPASGPAVPARPATAPVAGGRRFGQHFETQRSPALPTPIEPEPPVSGGGRRFGQRS